MLTTQNDQQLHSIPPSSHEEEGISAPACDMAVDDSDHDPASIGEFEGMHYTILNSVFLPDPTQHPQIEYNFKKKSQCMVIKKGKQGMSTNDKARNVKSRFFIGEIRDRNKSLNVFFSFFTYSIFLTTG